MTAKAVRYDGWCIVLGQDFRQKFVVKDPTLPKIPNPDYDPDYPESIENRKDIYQPKDLTGWDVKMTIRDQASLSGVELITLDNPVGVNNGITIGSPDPADGTIELFIDNTLTEAAPFTTNVGEGYYDLWLIPPTPADNQRILFGTIDIVEPVTDV